MTQFTTLYKKNWLFWKRDTCCCSCQIVCAFAFGLIFTLIKILSGDNQVSKNASTYLNTQYDIKLPFMFQEGVASSFTSDKAYLDSVVSYIGGLRAKKISIMKDCNLIPERASREKGGDVAIITKNSVMQENLNYFFTQMGFATRYFTSVADLNSYVTTTDYGQKVKANGRPDIICFAVSFNEDSGNKWSYNLHFNSSGNPATIEVPDPANPQEIKFKEEDAGQLGTSQYLGYLSSGYSLIQNVVDSLILRMATGSMQAHIRSRMVNMPTVAYSDNGLYSVTNSGQVDTYVIFPLLVVYLGFIYHMLKEKEKKITENLRNMGMSLMPHYLSWYAFYATVLFGISLIWTIIVKFTFFLNSNFICLWIMFILPGLAMLSLAMIVCAFFVTAKPGVLTGIIFFFVMYGVSIGKSTVESPTEAIYTWFALSPLTGLAMAISNVVLLESYNNYGFGFEHFNVVSNYFAFSTFVIITILEAFIFFWIGVYLDQVWPTEIGLKKHPLFCFGVKNNKEFDTGKHIEIDEKYKKENYEELTPDLADRQKNDLGNTIKIRNLRKVYSNGKVAVHNLDLDMFSNQIFALLGHNGAGKTTTISMISGLLSQTTGSIEICGFDTRTEYDRIKEILGVCPQQNPIYDNLTCKEHLMLYGNLKYQGKQQVTEEEINQILIDIDLREKKDFVAGRLSGGQKRKLCIGIAFIGGSKVILLDEPTSGMDTYARRFLWEMIKKYKKDRIIILCTHYMDEADFLGDRFGIMGEGRLITCGSSLFLKKRFGVGYDLTIVKTSTSVPAQPIDKLVTSYVSSAEKTGDISLELKYRLPNDQSKQFEALFKVLEDQRTQYGVQSFGISLTTLEEVFLKVAVGIQDGKNEAAKGEERAIVKPQDSDLDFDLESIRRKGTFEVFRMHFLALCIKRFIYFKRDYKGLFCEIFLPCIIVTAGLAMTLFTFVRDPKESPLTPDAYLTTQAQIWVNYPSGDSKIKGIMDSLSSTSKFSVTNKLDVNDITAFQNSLATTRSNPRFWAYFMNPVDTSNKIYSYATFINTTVSAAFPLASAVLDSQILRDATSDSSAYIKTYTTGLKLSKQLTSFEDTADGFIAVFIIALAFAFIPAGVVLFIVKERENNSKHQQIVSGVSVYAYWLSNLLIDFCKYIIPGIWTGICISMFSINAFTEDDRYGMVWSLIVVFGPSIMTFTYLTSFMFSSAESAQIATFVVNFLAGFILTILSFALRAIKSTRATTLYFPELFLRLFPTFDFTWGLFQMSNAQIWQILYELPSKPKAWSRFGCIIDFFYLLFAPIVFLTLIFYIESRNSGSTFLGSDTDKILDLNAGDEDVKAERKEVMESDDYAIKVVDFAKEYTMISKQDGCCKGSLISKKVAVKGVSFGVKKGDCFGLLGTNGAGKTTTFKALSGEIIPSCGKTFINRLDLLSNMSKVRHMIGYCPQFDALLDNLTSREHLELYGAIKGIPYDLRDRLIEEKLQQLNLKQFEHIQAGTYSGGNKRKLSVAIALLGNPPVILLDEPSSGMDPEARRFMWSVVGKISTEKKHSSVVLTTHSMEEAEALSSKLAIMVEGSIECIGPVQRLKNKYGKGFEVELKIELPKPEDIIKMKQLISVQGNEGFNKETIGAALGRLDLQNYVQEIKAGGRLDAIHLQVSDFLILDLLFKSSFPRNLLQSGYRAPESACHRAVHEVSFR
jgi:ATP-binding cassette, subfamily A (ABC1), member 3